MKLLRYGGNPILSPNPANDWENLVVSNPGVIYDDGVFYMLYRAAGDDEDHVIRFGLATSTDGFHFTRACDAPVFGPSADGPDAGCVEDPRIVKFGDCFYVTYAFRPVPPGRYWTFAHDVVRQPDCDGFAPRAYRDNLGGTALACTRDFRHFRRLGRLTSPVLDDRDVILFPEKIGGKFAMLHRPKDYRGLQFPSIWLKFSDDLLDWAGAEDHLLIEGIPGTKEEKIGGSTPPILTDRGWLVLYHGVADGGLSKYTVWAMLLDRDNPLRVLARTTAPILEPEMPYECEGLYPGCVFPVGNVVKDGTLYVYYGAADKYVGVATCPLDDLLNHLINNT